MNHLSDEQFARHLSAEADAATSAHLDECAACREEATRITILIQETKAAVAEVSARSPAFWTLQRAAVLSRTRGASRRVRVWAAIGVFAVLLFTSTSILHTGHPKPAAPQKTAAKKVISDDALLSEVHATLQQQVPDALEPAQMLVAEREQAESGTVPGSHDSVLSRRNQ